MEIVSLMEALRASAGVPRPPPRGRYSLYLRQPNVEVLYKAHLEALSDYPGSSPTETLDRIIATYEPIKKVDQIIEAERLKRLPPAKPRLR